MSRRGSYRAPGFLLGVLIVGSFAGAAVTVTARAAAAAVTQYVDPGIAVPSSIATGPDGALWFTNHANNSIGRISTAGVVTSYSDASIANPTSIAAGSDGALWFTSYANNSIGRITTTGVITHFTDSRVAAPDDITSGPDGALWFTNHANNSIGRISTAGVVTSYSDASIANPTSIAAGSDGALWFTNYANNSIGRITTTGVVTSYPDPSGGPSNIAWGPDAAMWFTNHGNQTIGRISAGGVVTNFRGPGITSPYSITAGPDGAMWFTDGDHGIGRISAGGVVTHYTNPEIANPLGITAGPDGALWFDNPANSSIGRITVDTLPATVPDAPTGALVSDAGPTGLSVAFVGGFDGGAPVSAYTATCMSLVTEPTVTAVGPTSPIIVTGLVSQSPYQCTVRATNLVGASQASAPSSVIWPGTNGECGMPSAPSLLSTAPGNGYAVVSWAPAASGCVAGYIVTPYLGSVPQLSTLIPGTGTTTKVPNLLNGSTYRFTVSAENGSVEGLASPFTAPITIGTPAAVTALHVATFAPGTLHVTFTASQPNGAPVTKYTATCTSSNGGRTNTQSGPASPLTVSGLTRAKTYRCSVRATNRRGAGPASRASAPTRT